MWLVRWVESMGVATGCGCKEVYIFPHTIYPYSSCICSFLQQHPYILFIFLNVFHSLQILIKTSQLKQSLGEPTKLPSKNALMCTYIYTHNTHAQTHAHTHACMHIHALPHLHMHTYTHTHTQTHTHIHTHKHTHTNTHTHTHERSKLRKLNQHHWLKGCEGPTVF